LLYGSETWVNRKTDVDRIQTAGMGPLGAVTGCDRRDNKVR